MIGTPAPDVGDDRQPHRVDLHVGLKIRQHRRGQGMSQEQLAQALGLTFQQVQKYERGANRVSASKLYEAAGALNCQIADFFAGLPEPAGDAVVADGAADPFLVMSGLTYGATLAVNFGLMTPLDRSILARLAQRFAEGNGDLPTSARADNRPHVTVPISAVSMKTELMGKTLLQAIG
jgi:DNA-binding XRE family transcriptional regulator